MKDILVEQAFENGIRTRHSDMENGEFRYRLCGKDGSSYIRTEASKDCWENSHFHKCCKEMYIVQSGQIFFCELYKNSLKIRKMSEGDYFLTEPNIAHTVFMTEGAVTHTVKFGHCVDNDWHASEELDRLTHYLKKEDLECRITV